MSDPDIARMLGRLEKAVEDGQKENARRFDVQSQRQADQDKILSRIAERVDTVEKRMAHVESTANAAKRQASESSAEITAVNASMIKHIDLLETAINDGKLETSMRLDAQDRVLQGQNKTLGDIQAIIQSQAHAQTAAAFAVERREVEASKRFDKRLALAVGVIAALVPVLSKLVDVLAK